MTGRKVYSHFCQNEKFVEVSKTISVSGTKITSFCLLATFKGLYSLSTSDFQDKKKIIKEK